MPRCNTALVLPLATPPPSAPTPSCIGSPDRELSCGVLGLNFLPRTLPPPLSPSSRHLTPPPCQPLPARSMRLKVKLTIQGEVLNGAILQQSFVVEYVVERHMCPTCNRQNANPNSWVACVQVGGGGGGGDGWWWMR